jgi:hypothetical protein
MPVKKILKKEDRDAQIVNQKIKEWDVSFAKVV